MKTRAAIVWQPGGDWEVEEVELDPPKWREVLIHYTASGLCHSDEHIRKGDMTSRFPIVGGHEGAGIIEAVGPGVTRVQPGDHVVCSFIASCGHCRWCLSGQSNLCDQGAENTTGRMLDGTFRFHARNEEVGGFCMLGTFSEWSVIPEDSCVKIENHVSLETACIVGCGVPTGFGSAVNVGQVGPGSTVVVYGVGGVGSNAVQGARLVGARNIIAVDLYENRLQLAKQLGATETFTSPEQAHQRVLELTRGVGADVAIITLGEVIVEIVDAAFEVIRKGGRIVLTGVARESDKTIQLSGTLLTNYQKSILGHLYGMCNPHNDILRLIGLYEAGQWKLDELIGAKYALEDVNQAYSDLREGRLTGRGVIVY